MEVAERCSPLSNRAERTEGKLRQRTLEPLSQDSAMCSPHWLSTNPLRDEEGPAAPEIQGLRKG